MNERIYLIEGKDEFKVFLLEKEIKFQRATQDSLDALTWINIIDIGVNLLSIILMLKRWHQEKNKQNNVILNIDQKVTININLDSEEMIQEKLKAIILQS